MNLTDSFAKLNNYGSCSSLNKKQLETKPLLINLFANELSQLSGVPYKDIV